MRVCEAVLAAAVRLRLFLSACGCTRVCLCRHTWVIITERQKNTKLVLGCQFDINTCSSKLKKTREK